MLLQFATLAFNIKRDAGVHYSVLDTNKLPNIVKETVTPARAERLSMPNRVFVLDTNRKPLTPCRPVRARQMLDEGKAAVYRRFPFTIILKEAKPRLEAGAWGAREPQPVTLKVDPGSKTTGIALVQDGKVIFAAELEHRGQAIKDALEKRRAIRRGRRDRNTRYRKPKFQDVGEKTTARPKGWLAPSLKSRVDNLKTWFTRFFKLCNLTNISMELVRFDMQLMQDAEVSGVEYQQGELQGYEVREYLLEKYSRKCCYCGALNVPFEVEHITPKSRGGTGALGARVSNLGLACHDCNEAKGNQTAAEFGFPNIQAQAKKPLKDASAVNSVRWAIFGMFKSTGLPVKVGTGGRTKFNRTKQAYPKAHWIDAACVGESGAKIRLDPDQQPLLIKAVGRGSRQMCHMNKFGFPRTKAKSGKRFFGFQTGDMVKAIVPSGKHKGVYIGKVAVRATGSFAVLRQKGKVDGINQKHITLLQRSDGYAY